MITFPCGLPVDAHLEPLPVHPREIDAEKDSPPATPRGSPVVASLWLHARLSRRRSQGLVEALDLFRYVLDCDPAPPGSARTGP